jgi:hypothetical protein
MRMGAIVNRERAKWLFVVAVPRYSTSLKEPGVAMMVDDSVEGVQRRGNSRD